MAGIKNWSTSAASNNAAPPNGWPEGQAPSTVNNTGRQNMADIRSWYEAANFIDLGHTPTYASSASFRLSGDLTSYYTTNRPIQCTDSTALYGLILSSTYSSPNTTVTVKLDSSSAALSTSLASIAVGLLDPTYAAISAASSKFIQSGTGAVATDLQTRDRLKIVYVDDFGAAGDDDGTGSGTDDTSAFNAAIAAANGGWVAIAKGKKYRIASTLTASYLIRICSDAPPIFENASDLTSVNVDTSWFPTIVLDGTSLRGVADPSSSTTGYAINLKGLYNIRIIGVNSAPYVAHFRPTQGFFENILVEDFVYHGFWTRGGSLVKGRNITFLRCGRTDPTVNSWCHAAAETDVSSVNFRRGCSWLAEGRETANEAAATQSGNAAGRGISGTGRATTFSLENIWSDTDAGTTTLNTSPRDYILFGHVTFAGRNIGGYNGTWAGHTFGKIDNLYEETSASGGVTSGDGTPFGLVEYNSAIDFSGDPYPTGTHRIIRDKAFNSSNDFYGYDFHLNANHYKSRLQLGELILGWYDPDGSSTAWATYAAKGTTTNPSLYFDDTCKALLGSVGTQHVPYLGFPIYDNHASIAASGGTADMTVATVFPTIPGSQIGSYDIEIMAGSDANTWYKSWWKCSKTSTKNKFVKVAEIDEASTNITVAATGSGTSETLRITNNTGSSINAQITCTLVRNNQFVITD